MSTTREQHNWAPFLTFYSQQNQGRRTRLAVFETDDQTVNDFWIEDGLPLLEIVADFQNGQVNIDLLFDSYSHNVREVVNIKAYFSFDGGEDGLDLIVRDGSTTVLRFENE